MQLLDIDEIQAIAILDLQLRRLAALERQRIIDEAGRDRARDRRPQDILAKPGRQRQIIRDELGEIVEKYGDERRTRLVPYDGDVSDRGPHRRARTSSSRSPAPATPSAPRPTCTGRSGAAARACRARR